MHVQLLIALNILTKIFYKDEINFIYKVKYI